MKDRQPIGLSAEVVARERRQTVIDAGRAPRLDAGRAFAGVSLVLGGQGLEAGVTQPIVRDAVRRDPDAYRGPNGF